MMLQERAASFQEIKKNRNHAARHPPFFSGIKKPTREGWLGAIGGDGGNRTRVRQSSALSSTCLVCLLI